MLSSSSLGSPQELIYLQYLKSVQNYKSVKPLIEKPGHWSGIYQFAFTWAIIQGRMGDESGYDDRWCYSTEFECRSAWEVWNGAGEPEGWHRHPMTGRRRPLGDATQEYVNP